MQLKSCICVPGLEPENLAEAGLGRSGLPRFHCGESFLIQGGGPGLSTLLGGRDGRPCQEGRCDQKNDVSHDCWIVWCLCCWQKCALYPESYAQVTGRSRSLKNKDFLVELRNESLKIYLISSSYSVE